MTQEELMEEKYLLEKPAKHAVFEILHGEVNTVITQVSHSFEGKQANNYKITIEKVGK